MIIINKSNSNAKQAVLPILISDYLDICDPVLNIDGSKFEANANKYSWVWKKAAEKSRYRLFDKITKMPAWLLQQLHFL